MSGDIVERLRADIRYLVVSGYEARFQRDALAEIERLRRIEAAARDLAAAGVAAGAPGQVASLWLALHAALGAGTTVLEERISR